MKNKTKDNKTAKVQRERERERADYGDETKATDYGERMRL